MTIPEKLTGWGAGAVLNPPGAQFPDPRGQKNYTLQATLTPSQVFTVQFAVGNPKNPEARNTPVAIIEWAVNGVTVRRKVSAVNGVSLTGVGEAVYVKVFDEGNTGSESPYSSSTTVSIGTRGGFEPPTLQNQPAQSIISGGGSALFPIERDAGVVAVRILVVSGTTLNPEKINVRFLDNFGAISGFQNPNVNGFVQVPPTAVSVLVENNDAVNIDAFPIFAIDG